MKRKLRSWWIAAILLFSCQTLSAYDFEVDEIYYTIISASDPYMVEVTDGSYSYTGSVTIPSSVEYSGNIYGVIRIADNAFKYCSELISVTLPEGITSIGDYAFYDCYNMTSIKIPGRVFNIGYSAFTGCSSLPVKDDIRYADTYLVEVTDKTLAEYTIKANTKFIGTSAFKGCSNMTKITIPSQMISIGEEAFAGCGNLEEINIPKSVNQVGNDAFEDCESLPVINNIRYADTYLVRVVDLTAPSYTVKEGTRFIAPYAFFGCSKTPDIYIPQSVTHIGAYAFSF